MNTALNLMNLSKKMHIVDTMVEELTTEIELQDKIEDLEDIILEETEYLKQEKDEKLLLKYTPMLKEMKNNLKNLKLKQHRPFGERYDRLEELKDLRMDSSVLYQKILDIKYNQ